MEPQKWGDDLKFLSWVEIIGEVRCNVALIMNMIPWYESGGRLGMIYRVISQFSLAIFVNKDGAGWHARNPLKGWRVSHLWPKG